METTQDRDYWLESVQWVCRHFGVRCHPLKLKSGIPLNSGMLDQHLFPRALEKARLTSVETSVNDLTKASFPIFAMQKETADPIILTGIEGNRVTMLSVTDEFKQQVLDVTELKKLVTSHVWQISVEPESDKRIDELTPKKTTHWLWAVVREVKPWYRDLFVASFVINLLALVVPLFTMNVYDRVVPNQAFNTLWVLAAGVAVIIVFDWILRESRSSVTDMAGRYIDNKLSAILFNKTLGMKLEHRPQSVGAFARQLQDFDSVKEFFTSVSLVTLVDLPFTVFFLVLIGWLGGIMMVVPVGVMALLLMLSWLMKGKVESTINETSRLSTQRQAQLFDTLTALSDIKQNNAQGTIQKRWEQTISSLSDWQVRSRRYTNIVSHSIQSSQQIVTISLIIAGVYQIAAGVLSMGGLIAVVMLSGRAASAINQLTMLMLRFQQSRTALEGLDQIMALPQEDSVHQVMDRGLFKGHVKLTDVGFVYPGMQSESLSGINLEIKPGERIGVVGAAGAGKSTLLSILLKQFEASNGQVFYEGIDAQLWPASVVRSTTASVPQTASLIYGTVYENILLGDDDVDEESLTRAINLSGLNNYMSRLANGLETQVGEGGRLLSGGQKQAVSLARALYREPKFLVMDEPTSALDSQAERRFYQTLQSLPRSVTMVISSHRQSFLTICDRIIVLDGGKIVLEGTPKEVFARQSNKSRVKSVSVISGGSNE